MFIQIFTHRIMLYILSFNDSKYSLQHYFKQINTILFYECIILILIDHIVVASFCFHLAKLGLHF